MKITNVKFTAFAHFNDGTIKCRCFCTEEAMSKWANKQYRIDEDVTVEVYEGAGVTDKKYCTYHA